MEFHGELEERLDKNNKPYTVLLLNLTDNVQKMIFLTSAEQELIKLTTDEDYED